MSAHSYDRLHYILIKGGRFFIFSVLRHKASSTKPRGSPGSDIVLPRSELAGEMTETSAPLMQRFEGNYRITINGDAFAGRVSFNEKKDHIRFKLYRLRSDARYSRLLLQEMVGIDETIKCEKNVHLYAYLPLRYQKVIWRAYYNAVLFQMSTPVIEETKRTLAIF